MNYAEQIKEAAGFLVARGVQQPTVGIVLGTGLGKLTGYINSSLVIPYDEIPYFPVATVEFHSGKLIFGQIDGTNVLAMQGRFHYYEGYTMQQITFPVRVMHALGISKLLLSNAAGGINTAFKKGDLVLIDDHINLQPENPLRGLNDAVYGTRFPDMSMPYDTAMGSKLKEKSAELSLNLQEGVYVSVMGPNLETRAEYRFLRIIGADMVGMSTVPEVIVANQLGMKCAAVSVITDECDPDCLQPVKIEEIVEAAGKADGKLSKLFAAAVPVL